MRSIQEIFDVVIDAHIYPEQRLYMCLGLGAACAEELISMEERDYAEAAILDYLNGDPTMCLAKKLGFIFPDGPPSRGRDMVTRFTYDYCLPIYKDWANRPKLGVK